MYVFFFFKQKTAYEMRISDWSSDVCSSDLHCGVFRVDRLAAMLPDIADGGGEHDVAARRARVARDIFHLVEEDLLRVDRKSGFALEIGRASCRESVCQYG